MARGKLDGHPAVVFAEHLNFDMGKPIRDAWTAALKDAQTRLFANSNPDATLEQYTRDMQLRFTTAVQAVVGKDVRTKPQWWPDEQNENYAKGLVRATHHTLLKVVRDAHIDLIATPMVLEVETHLRCNMAALKSGMELDLWKIPERISDAIKANPFGLFEASEKLAGLNFHHNHGMDAYEVLQAFVQFYGAVLSFCEGENGIEPNADNMMDVGLYTLVQSEWPSDHVWLYYHLQVVEKLCHPSWLDEPASVALTYMESWVQTLYTINARHFKPSMDAPDDTTSHPSSNAQRSMSTAQFISIMQDDWPLTSPFRPRDFIPRAKGVAPPPPFGTGPPLGDGLDPAEAAEVLSEEEASKSAGASRQQNSAAPAKDFSNSRRSPGTRRGKVMGSRIADLTEVGMKLVSKQGIKHASSLYPFFLQDAEDLFVADIPELLAGYKKVVLELEAMRAGLQDLGIK